jgi:hypothetical protein
MGPAHPLFVLVLIALRRASLIHSTPTTTTAAAAADPTDTSSRPARTLLLPANDADALALLLSLEQKEFVKELLLVGRSSVVQRAVAQGVVDPNLRLKSRDGVDFPLIHTAAAVDAVPLLRLLIFERDVDPNEPAGDGFSPLHAAIGNLKERAALFLTRNVPHIDVNVRWLEGKTPLMLAAQRGMLEVMKALMAKGAQVDQQDNEGRTALIYAASGK